MSRSSKGTKATEPSAATKLEDDELVKAIGGQLDANFDYSQWQRADGGKSILTSQQKGVKGRKAAGTSPTTRTTFTVSTPATGDYGGMPLPELTSSSPRNRRSHKKKKETKTQRIDRHRKEEHDLILQLRIRHKKHTIEEFTKRYDKLLEENLKVKSEIEAQEKGTHNKVKKLLRMYEKFRGGIATLNNNFMKELSDAQEDRDAAAFKIDVEITTLERDVENVDKKLRENQLELHILMNYKDKEYPVKSQLIAELQKQITELKTIQLEELQELQHVVETEREKHKRQGNQETMLLNQVVMQKSMANMHPSVKDMATQNNVMVKEVQIHKKEMDELTESLQILEKEVKDLMHSPKTNLQQQLFPQFFPTQEKCTPDMDVILDIPVQKWLPI